MEKIEDYGIINTYEKKEEPYSKCVCCYCKKWKRLISVGKYQESSEMCESCLNNISKEKGDFMKSKYGQLHKKGDL